MWGSGRTAIVPAMRVSEAIALYLSQREGEVSTLTHRNLGYTLNKLSAMHGGLELADLDATKIRDWRNHLTVSAVSANKYVDRVRAFLNYARDQGWMERGPAKVSPLTAPPVQQLRLDIDQIASLLEQPNNWRDRAAIAVSMEWLLRGAEIRELRVGGIPTHPRPGDEADVLVMKTEGVFAWDKMTITERLLPELESWLHRYEANVGRRLEPDDYLLPRMTYRIATSGRQMTLHPKEPMSHPYLILHRALSAIGVDVGRRGFHTIRRSMARVQYDALAAQGVPDPVGVISALLHHKSRKTTELYLGVSGDRDRRNALMRSTSWVSALPSATTANTAGRGLATVTRLHS